MRNHIFFRDSVLVMRLHLFPVEVVNISTAHVALCFIPDRPQGTNKQRKSVANRIINNNKAKTLDHKAIMHGHSQEIKEEKDTLTCFDSQHFQYGTESVEVINHEHVITIWVTSDVTELLPVHVLPYPDSEHHDAWVLGLQIFQR